MNEELTSLAHEKVSKLTNLSQKESPLCLCSFILIAKGTEKKKMMKLSVYVLNHRAIFNC